MPSGQNDETYFKKGIKDKIAIYENKDYNMP